MLKRKLKQALSIMLAFMLMFGSLFVHVKPLESSATENYRLWRQFDPRWGSIQMGNTTMARSGCLVTAIAILAVHSGSKNPNTFTPGYFANSLNSINAFDSGGAIASWASITKVIPDVRVVTYTGFNSSTQSGKAAEIKQQMQKGYHVVCNVNGHWVYVEGVDGDDVYMIDPAKDDILMFDSYGNSNVIAMEVMTAKNPPSDVIGALTTTSLTTTTASETTTTTAATTTTTETTTTTTLTSTTTVPPTTTSTTTTSTTTTTTTSTTTSTTTTSTTTTTTSTTTTTASLSTTTTPVTTTASPPDYSESICVTALAAANSDIEGNNSLSYIERGNVVKVLSVKDGMAEIRYGDSVAYVAEAFLVPAAKHEKSIMGDVNFDGIVDIRDLSLINDYIFAKPRLPDGISLFTDEQLRASDVSGDGITDKKDLTAIMLMVCK